MKKVLDMQNFEEVVNNLFLSLLSDTTHGHISSVLRYGKPGLELLEKHSLIRAVSYDTVDLWDLLLPFYISNVSGLESRWCAPNTTQLDVKTFINKYDAGEFVPQREKIQELMANNVFSFDYSGFGLVVGWDGISVIVDGSKRACVAALKAEAFQAIEIRSKLVPLLWSCEFFQSCVLNNMNISTTNDTNTIGYTWTNAEMTRFHIGHSEVNL